MPAEKPYDDLTLEASEDETVLGIPAITSVGYGRAGRIDSLTESAGLDMDDPVVEPHLAPSDGPTLPRPGIHPMYQTPLESLPAADVYARSPYPGADTIPDTMRPSPLDVAEPRPYSHVSAGPPVFDLQPPSTAPLPGSSAAAGIYPASRILENAQSTLTAELTAEFGNTSGRRQGVPHEVASRPWNWGAFLLTPAWCASNGAQTIGYAWALLFLVALLAAGFVPAPIGRAIGLLLTASAIGVGVFAGLRGNTVAWENRRFEDVDDFAQTQRAWAIAGYVSAGAALALGSIILAIVSITTAPRPSDDRASSTPAVVVNHAPAANPNSPLYGFVQPMNPVHAQPPGPSQVSTPMTSVPQSSGYTQAPSAQPSYGDYGGPPPAADQSSTPQNQPYQQTAPAQNDSQYQDPNAQQQPADSNAQPAYNQAAPSDNQQPQNAAPPSTTQQAPSDSQSTQPSSTPAAPQAPEYGGPPPAQ